VSPLYHYRVTWLDESPFNSAQANNEMQSLTTGTVAMQASTQAINAKKSMYQIRSFQKTFEAAILKLAGLVPFFPF